jgi:hypothetical protein
MPTEQGRFIMIVRQRTKQGFAPTVEALDRRTMLSGGLGLHAAPGEVQVEAKGGAKDHHVSGGGTATIDAKLDSKGEVINNTFSGKATPFGQFSGSGLVLYDAYLGNNLIGGGTGTLTAAGGTLNFKITKAVVDGRGHLKGTITPHGGTGLFAHATGKIAIDIVDESVASSPFTLNGTIRY